MTIEWTIDLEKLIGEALKKESSESTMALLAVAERLEIIAQILETMSDQMTEHNHGENSGDSQSQEDTLPGTC